VETAALLASDAAQAAIALHGTPVLLLDAERVRGQYRRLCLALPFVRFHYAVKALSHDAVIDALADEGCSFDIATSGELALLRRRGIAANRAIHTHPIKKPAEIVEAVAAGIRTFVVDNETELAKFEDARDGVRVLIRLAYRSPHAKSDLSSKFGVGAFEAARLVERAVARGIPVAGFSFHVGSQLDDPARFVRAIVDTLALMDDLEKALPVRFDTLDIGGGFPVSYDAPAAELERVAAAIRPLLEPRAGDLDIIAEPGRILVAEAMTLVSSVVGVSERGDGRWYYLDDGVYGSYSNVVAEDVHPLVFAASEIGRNAPSTDTATHRWATLAGPTCDSADVVAREVLLPELAVGDLVVSPAMGAYTAVTATRFNGREPTPIAVLESGPPTGGLAAVPTAAGQTPHAVAGATGRRAVARDFGRLGAESR
jgi:ornithine decarboxylase